MSQVTILDMRRYDDPKYLSSQLGGLPLAAKDDPAAMASLAQTARDAAIRYTSQEITRLMGELPLYGNWVRIVGSEPEFWFSGPYKSVADVVGPDATDKTLMGRQDVLIDDDDGDLDISCNSGPEAIICTLRPMYPDQQRRFERYSKGEFVCPQSEGSWALWDSLSKSDIARRMGMRLPLQEYVEMAEKSRAMKRRMQ
jgi:hypothetical protein